MKSLNEKIAAVRRPLSLFTEEIIIGMKCIETSPTKTSHEYGMDVCDAGLNTAPHTKGAIMKKTFVAIILLTIGISAASAHSGRTNKDGCHHDRKAGTYHCH